MKFLVIGLGSMGKRRIRCLKTLGHSAIIGYDLKTERRNEAEEKYNIITDSRLDNINLENIDAMIVSVPPDLHLDFVLLAIKNNIPVFIEASVLSDHNLMITETLKQNESFVAPSCTFKFHPIIKNIKLLIQSNEYGSVTNFTYHSGQYLPDWHPWENVKDFYVSKRITGGAREIVPFELTWIVDVFGFPIDIKGYFTKTMDVGADIEDTYSFNMKYAKSVGSIIIDVAARFATRNLILNLEKAQLRWNWEDGLLKIYDATAKDWKVYKQPEGQAEEGYNKNIIEQMYIDEVKAFIDGINDRYKYPNNIEDDLKVLRLLDSIENSDGGFNR